MNLKITLNNGKYKFSYSISINYVSRRCVGFILAITELQYFTARDSEREKRKIMRETKGGWEKNWWDKNNKETKQNVN